MGHHLTEPERERRSRKKSSHSSSKPSKSKSSTRKRLASPSAPNLCVQHPALPVQAASTQNVSLHPHFTQNGAGPPPGYSSSPPRHPIYGQMPQYPQSYGLPPMPATQPYANMSAPRFASPPPPQQQPRQAGALKGQWNRIDHAATKSYTNLQTGVGKSVSKLTTNYIERPTHAVAMKSMQTLCRGAALCDVISSKFDAVMTSIDDERFSGKEQDLLVFHDQLQQSETSSPPRETSRGPAQNNVYPRSGGDKGSNHFSKVWLYSNSRLPPHLPPFKVYMPTYPLLCLAATYSERVYTPPGPKSRETETHIPSDWRSGTKAMVLKSVPVEDLNTIVFAIRGSQTFMDWAVNYNSAPNNPTDFLDDASNLCHAGFLFVAKKMVKPVADRLRVLLQENPARSNCSLLITGHSAGGAVAALLYAHMMSTKVESELNYLTSFFKRVHCITFGAPPVSLYPLKKSNDRRHRKSLFYAFINEGDPVPRADKGVVRSLLKLYASSAPSLTTGVSSAVLSASKINLAQATQPASPPRSKWSLPRLGKPSKPIPSSSTTTPSLFTTAPAWPIPVCTLAPAGRLVVLRQKVKGRGEGDVEAVTVEEDMLRNVVFGDPLKHMMSVYRKRIEGIAVRAVTARGY